MLDINAEQIQVESFNKIFDTFFLLYFIKFPGNQKNN